MLETLKSIVIATSLTEASENTVRAGVAIARAMGATPWLVHAHSWPASASELLGTLDGTWTEEHLQAIRERLAAQAQRAGFIGLPGFGPLQLRPMMGPAPGAIVEVARQVEADLIVVGAAEGQRRQVLLGSTTERVIRHAPCPVLVVRSPSTFPPSRVEIAVDRSPISANAIRRGLNFLTGVGVDLAGTEVLFVLRPPEGSASTVKLELSALNELHRFLEANGVNPELARVRIGNPWEEILAVLEERRADLVVLGTRGSSGCEEPMLGSVALAVMHRAPCNLLIVPPAPALPPKARPMRENGVERIG